MQGKRRASKVFDTFSQRKVSKSQLYSGVLGIVTNGAATVKVTGRNNFVWVRLRNASNEVIQAFNDGISNTYDLPVLVEYDPHNPVRYRVIDRDVGRYQNWGGSSTQMAPHGWSHSFTPDGSGGGDPVWVYSRQVMPFLVAPSGTAGYLGAIVYSHTYYHNNAFHYAGDTGTPNLSIYKPTDNQARMVLLYLETDSGNIMVATGTSSDFTATITGSAAIVPYIPDLPDTNDIPLAGVRLLSGTSSIQWANLYDVRPFFYPPGGLGGAAPTTAQYVTMALNGTLTQERVLTAGSDITITDGGANGNVTVGVSTGTFSRANHTHPGGSSDNTVLVYDDHVFKVTGTAIDFVDNLSVAVTGSVAYIAGQAGGGGGSNVIPIFDNGAFKATGTVIDFGDNINVVVTGSAVFVSSVDTTGGGGGSTLLVYDDSTFKVTGTAISFDDNLSVSVTGSVAYVSAALSTGTGAPVEATYFVESSHAGLSAEILHNQYDHLGNLNSGNFYTSKIENSSIATGTSSTLLSYSGAGVVRKLFIAISSSDWQARERSLIKVYIDGEGSPSVSATVVNFHASDYTPNAAFGSRYIGYNLSGNNVSYYHYINIPFSTSIQIDLENAGSASMTVWAMAEYNAGVAQDWGRRTKLHTVEQRVTVAKYAPQVLLDVSGTAGALHGLYMLMDGGDSNFNFLEGNIHVFVDGSPTGTIQWSGTEDYFGWGFYGQGGAFVTDYVGCPKRTTVGYSIGFYRFHIEDQIPFDDSIKIIWYNGDAAQATVVNSTYLSSLAWYYSSA